MKFPYGICDFYKMMTEDYFYVDRTAFIAPVEEWGSNLLFLRPRRFGKSLWLSTLENYYDLAKAEEFVRLFGHLAIGQNPTPRHNQYFVMKWDFSMVDPSGEPAEIRQALHEHVNDKIAAFAKYYHHWLPYALEINQDNAISSFESLLMSVRGAGGKLYLLIDEYDNFANEVLMSARGDSQVRYEALLYGEGALKAIFKAVKAASAGAGLDRTFITGVAPVVLSDLSSGYNIAQNIYLEPALNPLCGFTEAEVTAQVAQIKRTCASALPLAEPETMLRNFYNGYRFSPDAAELIYNPTLALYFLAQYQRYGTAPRQMLDSNLAMDRGKITYIAQLPGGPRVLGDALRGTPPVLLPQLADRFGVADVLHAPKDYTFMASLLYYFGILTCSGRGELGELGLRIPNLVIRKLYVERMQELWLPATEQYDAAQLSKTFYRTGELPPLCAFIERRFAALDNRDYRWANEFAVKLAFLTVLFNDLYYLVDSETAVGRGYADLTLIVRPDMRQYPLLDLVLEFKYVSLADAGLRGETVRGWSVAKLQALPVVQEKLAAARTQLAEYRRALTAAYGDKLQLRSYAVVAVGFERLVGVEIT